MPLRDDERLSAEALKAYLEGVLGYTSAIWSPIDADPPDVEFFVKSLNKPNERWAVEITGLFQYAEQDGSKVNLLAFTKLQEMVECLSSKYQHEIKLNYALWIGGPLSIKLLNDLPNRILQFVRSGQIGEFSLDHAEAVEKVCVSMNVDHNDPAITSVLQQFAPPYERVKINAHQGPPGIQIQIATTLGMDSEIPGSDRPIGNIPESVAYSVNRILDAKLPKLMKIDGFDRRIILIWSGFALAKASEVAAAIADRRLKKEDVDGIFFISSGWTETTLVADFVGIGPTH